MARNKFRTPYNFVCFKKPTKVGTYENCDSIISEIGTVFSLYGKIMLLEDKKQLLSLLKYIEKNKKTIKSSIKKEMYEIVDTMRHKYRAMKRQNTDQKTR